MLTRYADVWAALRHPHLWAVNGKRKVQPDARDETGRLKQRAAMLEALSASHLEFWKPRVEMFTRAALERLPCGPVVDLFREFALPWGLSLAILATGLDAADRAMLSSLSTRVFAATGVEGDPALKADAAAATAELERILENGPIPMGEPAFVALSQTLPRLLASMWLALAGHPAEYARLRAQPTLLPGAMDELLRYAGIVRRVYRRATAEVELGGVRIAEGGLAVLMLTAANRDPEQFPDPDRLDVGRDIGGQVALGTGRNSCVGSMLIRMAAGAATGALTGAFAEMAWDGTAEWKTGSGFCFPVSVPVTLRR